MVDADTENTCRLSISEQAAVENDEANDATEEEAAGPPHGVHLCLRCTSQQAATLICALLLQLLLPAARLMRDEAVLASGRSRWAPAPRANRSMALVLVFVVVFFVERARRW